MPLRTKVLGLFLVLGVLPLIGLGAVEYARSLDAVEALLVAQNARLADRVAAVIHARTTRMESDLLLLAENAESQRWLRSSEADAEATAALQQFFNDAWSRLQADYQGVQLTDARGRTLGMSHDSAEFGEQAQTVLAPVVRSIRDDRTGRELGSLRVQPRAATLLAAGELPAGFGEQGQGLVLDRTTGAVIFHSAPQASLRTSNELFGADFRPEQLASTSGSLRFVAGDTDYVAAFRRIDGAPWTVVMAAAVSEFSAPFTTVGRSTLITFTIVAVLAALLFGGLVGRTTRSLEELTAAASVVGQGNFAPALPRASGDEVGRLSAAFGTMVARVRDMMEEVQAKRQMAVLGEFAAQLSHEVRNPLTSIKMNQQRIQRFLDERDAPADIRQSMTIALREVDRLDGVVQGVLQLARQATDTREWRSPNALVREVIEVVSDQAKAQHVNIDGTLDDGDDQLQADAVRLKGALLNLVINALEAMPAGGTVRLNSVVADGNWQLSVTDTGPGIPEDRRSSVFNPFASTKAVGTGLGLPIARRAIEEHGGTLSLGALEADCGATFVVKLPLVRT